jgi:hypothetical protein
MSKPTVKHREPVTLIAPSALTSHVATSVLTASAIITSLATKATLALPASLALPSSLAAPAAFSASLLTSTRSPQKPTDFNLKRAVVLNIAVNPTFAKLRDHPPTSSLLHLCTVSILYIFITQMLLIFTCRHVNTKIL